MEYKVPTFSVIFSQLSQFAKFEACKQFSPNAELIHK